MSNKNLLRLRLAATSLAVSLSGCLFTTEPPSCSDPVAVKAVVDLMQSAYRVEIPQSTKLDINDLMTLGAEMPHVISYDAVLKIRTCELTLASHLTPEVMAYTDKAFAETLKPSVQYVLQFSGEDDSKPMVRAIPLVDMGLLIRTMAWSVYGHVQEEKDKVLAADARVKASANAAAAAADVGYDVRLVDSPSLSNPASNSWDVYPESSLVCGSEALCVRTRQGAFYRLNSNTLTKAESDLLFKSMDTKSLVCFTGVSSKDGQGMRDVTAVSKICAN